MRRHTFIATIGATVLAALALGACGGASDSQAKAGSDGLPQGSEPVKLDPADFTLQIDNPYWPMRPGSRWVYRETDTTGARQRVVVTVTHRTKTVAAGVTARVVRDVATEDGKPVEITEDWYAQDRAGNVWYLGEAVRNYEHGRFADREGSFEAGVDGAQAGIVMPADPQPGLAYRQEYLKGEAEDRAAIVARGADRVQVPAGFFAKDVLVTRELAATEPKTQELKFYVRGIGEVLSLHTDGDGERSELVRSTRGGGGGGSRAATALLR
jgi:hypothetical protein